MSLYELKFNVYLIFNVFFMLNLLTIFKLSNYITFRSQNFGSKHDKHKM